MSKTIITDRLDLIASTLEAKGNFRLALAIDKVSDSFEKTTGKGVEAPKVPEVIYTPVSGDPEDLKKMESLLKSKAKGTAWIEPDGYKHDKSIPKGQPALALDSQKMTYNIFYSIWNEIQRINGMFYAFNPQLSYKDRDKAIISYFKNFRDTDKVSDSFGGREALDPSVQAPGQATNRVTPDTVAKAIGLQGWDDVRKPGGAHEGTMVSPNQKLSEVPALVGKIKPLINNAVDYANTYIDKKLVPDKSVFNNLSIRLPNEGADGMYYWESKNLDLFTGLITRLLTLPELKNATTGCVAGLVVKRGYLSPIDSIYLCGKPRV